MVASLTAYLTDKRVRLFWAKVERAGADDCWEWRGAKHPGGHGRFYIGRSEDGQPRSEYAHRFSYALTHGDVPAAPLVVHHMCFNPPCVNPHHLQATSHGDNLIAGPVGPAFWRSRVTHCPQGHEYTEENTSYKPSGWGRGCRQCDRDRAARYYRSHTTTCSRGHELAGDNLLNPDSVRRDCRRCRDIRRESKNLHSAPLAAADL